MTTIYPSGAVSISKHQPDSTDPVLPGYVLAGQDNGTWFIQGILQFTIPVIPVGAVPVLHLYLYRNALYDQATYTAYKLVSNPTLETLTWNNRPAIASAGSDTFTIAAQGGDPDTDKGWHTLDISDILDSDSVVTLMFCNGLSESTSAYSSHCTFYDDTNATYKPYIDWDDYYVNATTGLDTNDGTSANPWKTLDHAAANTPANATLHLTGDFTGEPTPNKIFPDNSGVKYEWESKVTVENNN